ncbi:Aste57867_20645 [Aphanomyces stellatus]|uniref:Aste57867_20645 protein n=1 Tax=Aphanomyces stellatus TaxID=120398 RepID=A0A485LFD9_9STRA|nr:hypothetical protein As57867_020577 [Aphanomyces stellatus]VFT97325.1 Aste57867_20645 [Aphanomyces stellatus]
MQQQACDIDALGRQIMQVAVAPGKLGIGLVEKDTGVAGVFVGHYDATGGSMHAFQRLVQPGDRLVALNGQGLEHKSLPEVIALLGAATGSQQRELTFTRTPSTLTRGSYDMGKVAQVSVPAGPLGLLLNQTIGFCAFVDGVLDTSPLRGHAAIHRGCRIIRINDNDVATTSREGVVALLGQLKDQPKTIEVYRMAPADCIELLEIELTPKHTHVQLTSTVVDKPEHAAGLRAGDVVVGVNGIDLSTFDAKTAVGMFNGIPCPKRVLCYRLGKTGATTVAPPLPPSRVHPSANAVEVTITDTSLGLNVDHGITHHLRFTGFATSDDERRPYYAAHRAFLPGSYVAALNGVDVSANSRDEVLALLAKLTLVPKTIVFVTEQDLAKLARKASDVHIQVHGGALGLDFDGNVADYTVISGFRPVNGVKGELEQSGLLANGRILVGINGFNVSRLKLHQTIDLLKKLADVPKRLTFAQRHRPTIDVLVEKGSIGVALDSTTLDKTIVQAVTPGTIVEATGGIAPGSQLVAIDGFDISALSLAKSTELLRALYGHPKVLSFTTRQLGWSDVSSIAVAVAPGPLGINFDSAQPSQAVIQAFAAVGAGIGDVQRHGDVAVGNRLVAIDGVDVRAKSLADVARFLKDLAASPKTLRFGAPWDPQHTQQHQSPRASIAPPTVPYPVARASSTLSDLANLQQKMHLSDEQMTNLQRRASEVDDNVDKPHLPRKLSSRSSDGEMVELQPPASPTKTNLAREYAVQTFTWMGKLKPQIVQVDKDQKYLLQYDVSNKVKTSTYKYVAVATLTHVTNGKTTSNFAKKSVMEVDNNVCLSVWVGKSSYDFIAASVDDRDALAMVVETLIRTRSKKV